MIPERFLDLFEKPPWDLATLLADGTPQVTPVWIDRDGADILVNVRSDRLKNRNMRQIRPSHWTSSIRHPFRYLSIRGVVVAIGMRGAFDHMDRMRAEII